MEVKGHAEEAPTGGLLEEPPLKDQRLLKVAVMGVPNAGKTTLVNQLLGKKVETWVHSNLERERERETETDRGRGREEGGERERENLQLHCSSKLQKLNFNNSLLMCVIDADSSVL